MKKIWTIFMFLICAGIASAKIVEPNFLPTKDEKHYVKLNRAILAGNIGLTDIFTGHDMAELQKRKTDSLRALSFISFSII